MVETKQILAKMHAIMSDIGYIQKDATNSFHGYSYASERAIKEAVGKALREHGVVFLMSTSNVRVIELEPDKKEKMQHMTVIDAEYYFMDMESGENIQGTFVSSGPARDDKGLWAATTNAIKYILTSNFLIATGDDAESDTNHPEPPKATPKTEKKENHNAPFKAALQAKAVEAGIAISPALYKKIWQWMVTDPTVEHGKAETGFIYDTPTTGMENSHTGWKILEAALPEVDLKALVEMLT